MRTFRVSVATPVPDRLPHAVVLYLPLAVLSGAPAFLKHTSHPVLLTLAYAALLAYIIWALSRNDPAGVFLRTSQVFAATLIVLLAAASATLYPATRRVAP